MEYLLRGGSVNGNASLWHQVADLLGMFEHKPNVNWIPSHWDPSLTDCPEDWHALWNGRADQMAGMTMTNRIGW